MARRGEMCFAGCEWPRAGRSLRGMSEARWEIRNGDKILGPYTDADVFQAIAGTLPPATPARLIGQEDWRPIGTMSPFAEVFVRRALAGQAPVASAAAVSAVRVKKIDTLGGGCFVQGLGALVGGGFILAGIGARGLGGLVGGMLVGLLFVLGGLVVGRRMSTRWTCGACGNPIAGADVRVCPTCKASLG